MSSTARNKAAMAHSEAIADAIRVIQATHLDGKMTLQDWAALRKFYTGHESLLNLSDRQQAMNDIIRCATSKIAEDDRTLRSMLTLYFAGNIAVVNMDDIKTDEPLTKKRRIRPDEEIQSVGSSSSSGSDNEDA